jgi:hypothetical protein
MSTGFDSEVPVAAGIEHFDMEPSNFKYALIMSFTQLSVQRDWT